MLRKRIIGTVLVRDNIAVQSFSYNKYLPLGDPIVLIDNLEHWGVDEIALVVMDRGNKGPDLELIRKISSRGLLTPLIYAGGIKTSENAISVIRHGAERLIIDSLLFDDLASIKEISYQIGAQALIASMPLIISDNKLKHYNYKTKRIHQISMDMLNILKKNYFSEILAIDFRNEGGLSSYNNSILYEITKLTNLSLIPFGGISENNQIENLLCHPNVSAVMIGNSLNYKENAVFHIKNKLSDNLIRLHKISNNEHK